jgi:pimeloyl-ACP methyl ester carboxylesterase
VNAPALRDFAALERWQSATPGPLLRGRRAAGRGPVLHFLSGNGFCGGVYWPWLRRFLPQYGLFLHDIEGQGESDAGARFSGVDAVVERIAAVIAEQGLADQPLIGVGHSFGAQLTVLLAARHPQLFRALVLTDPILFPPALWLGVRAMSLFGQHPFGKAARRRRERWPTRADAETHLRGRGIYRGWTEEAFQCFVDHAMEARGGEWVLRCPREIEADIFEQPAWPWSAWRKIRVPVLFLRGAQSYPFFPLAERWARWLNPSVQIEQLPGGHCFMQEDPAAAHGAVAGFLARL